MLAVLSLGLTQFSLGQAITDSFRGTVASIEGRDIVAQHFPAGTGSETTVLAPPADVAAVTTVLKADAGVASVRPGPASDDWASLAVTWPTQPKARRRTRPSSGCATTSTRPVPVRRWSAAPPRKRSTSATPSRRVVTG